MNRWHIRLFGTLRVSRGEDEFFRFSSRKTGSLLAFLAFYADQRHTRDALCDLLWPDEVPKTSRARLRVALTSLRHQLEPPGISSGTVIRSDGHEQIHLVGEALTTDVIMVNKILRTLLDSTGKPTDTLVTAGKQIVALCSESLLTGFYDDWVIRERDRMNQAVVDQLSILATQVPLEAGLEFAWHAARLDPLSEQPLFPLLSLLAQSDQHTAAQRIYQTFCRRLETDLRMSPSAKLQTLAESLPEGRERSIALPPTAKVIEPPNPPRSIPSPSFSRRLPLYLTRFFGRTTEIKQLHHALIESPLVTVTGPGGMGKTRLAVETAVTWEGASFFISLTEITDSHRIPAALCDALGENTKGTQDSSDALLARAASILAEATAPLLVLDNLEQIADSVGSILLTLLEKVPILRLLATSRLRLHLAGEQEFLLAPLPLPAATLEKSLEEAARVASLALFQDRARAARPDFQITARNREDIAAVCRMLEGNPLAIELVAARGGTMVPSQMREQLAQQGTLQITDRRAHSDDRHRSLYDAIDWSYQLLPSALRRFFAQLSVFRGGFTAESAAAVCGIEEENAAHESLARLRAHSLVGSLPDASVMRFSLLESLRTFGAEQLTSDEREAAYERYSAWFADMAELSDAASSGPNQTIWLERIDADLSNFRATMERDLIRNPIRALQVAGALATYWNLRGRPTEGRIWLEKAMTACPPSESETPLVRNHRSRALHGAGILAMKQGDGAVAQRLLEESLRLRRLSGDLVATASTLNNLGVLFLSRQEWDTSRRFLRESLALRRTANSADLAGSLLNLGVVEWEIGNYVAAKPLHEEALSLYRKRGDRVGESQALNNMGSVALSLGDFAEAEKCYEQSLGIKRIVGHPLGIAHTLSNVGICAMYQGRHATATAYFEEALAMFREVGSPFDIASELRNLGQTATYRGEWKYAFSLLSESLRMIRESDTPDDIFGTLEGFALFASARGESESVARLLGIVDMIRTATHSPIYPSERVAIDQSAGAARKALGEERFHSLCREGALLSAEDAVKLTTTLSP